MSEGPPELIQQPDALLTLAERLRQEPRLAVDTESNSLYAYQERVCLIQLSTPQADVLVDPLALPDLSPLGAIFASPAIEKSFHAAEYDLICLKRNFGFSVANLFDTRIAARTLGHLQTGLGDLLSQTFGVELNKRMQRADWGKRPLTPEQLDYARQDTHYLLELRRRLGDELAQAGRTEEVQEACAYLACANTVGDNGEPSFWDITNSRKLAPNQAAVLRELFLLRDQQARRLDRPPFKVLGDSALMVIAQAQPTDLEALSGLREMSPKQLQRYGQAILAAVERGRKAPHPRPPAAEPMDPAVIARYETVRQWRKRTAAERQVESDLILPRELMWEIARQAPRSLEGLQPIMGSLPWRLRTYGPAILLTLWG